jgi:hypothetical protein
VEEDAPAEELVTACWQTLDACEYATSPALYWALHDDDDDDDTFVAPGAAAAAAAPLL